MTLDASRSSAQKNTTTPNLPTPQALIDGPSTGVPRQPFTYRRLVLTPYVLKKLPRSAGSATVKKVWDASEVEAKWAKSAWCQKRQAQEKRRNTTDFERFEVMLLKKQRRRLVQVRFSSLARGGFPWQRETDLSRSRLSNTRRPPLPRPRSLRKSYALLDPPSLPLLPVSLSASPPPSFFCFRATTAGQTIPPPHLLVSCCYPLMCVVSDTGTAERRCSL